MRLGIVIRTIALLICSNTFMTMAWYGHLKYRSSWLPLAILSKLYADMGLQFVYIALSFYGWYEWLYGGENRSELHVSSGWRNSYAVAIAITVAFALILAAVFLVQPKAASHQEATADAPPPDSLPAMKSVESPS